MFSIGSHGEPHVNADRAHQGAEQDFFSALEGIRTPNLLIRSQMLYPLSYERWNCGSPL